VICVCYIRFVVDYSLSERYVAAAAAAALFQSTFLFRGVFGNVKKGAQGYISGVHFQKCLCRKAP